MGTTRKSLTKETWTNLGTGPIFIETPMLSNIAVCFDENDPELTSQDFHALHGPDCLTYEGEANCYVRALNDSGVVIFTQA